MGKGDPTSTTTKCARCSRRTIGDTSKSTQKKSPRTSGLTNGKIDKLIEVDLWDQATGGDRRIRRIDEVAELLRKATEDLQNLQERMGNQGPGDSQQDGAAVNRTYKSTLGDGTPEISPPLISMNKRKKVPMVPRRPPEKPSKLSFGSPSP